MRNLFWNIYIVYLKFRGHHKATQAVFNCHARLRLLILKAFGARIGGHTKINGPLILIGRYKDFSEIEVGENTHIGADTIIDLCEKVSIGSRVAISPRCSLITHLNVGAGYLKDKYPPVSSEISISDDVYIGTGVTILHGVTIGKGALVAAHSLVNEDVPDHVMVAGVPAKTIKKFEQN